MTTAQQQIQMFYQEGKKVLMKRMSDFLDQRNKERFKMVEEWRKNGKKDEDWLIIEQFDKDTDRQEKILEDILNEEHIKLYN